MNAIEQIRQIANARVVATQDAAELHAMQRILKATTPEAGDEAGAGPPNPQRMNGAVDQDAFEEQIRENLSPEGVATIIAFLQPAAFYKPANEDAIRGLRQAEWLADTLTEMLGVDEVNRLFEELGL
jgi:hypothetical protein